MKTGRPGRKQGHLRWQSLPFPRQLLPCNSANGQGLPSAGLVPTPGGTERASPEVAGADRMGPFSCMQIDHPDHSSLHNHPIATDPIAGAGSRVCTPHLVTRSQAFGLLSVMSAFASLDQRNLISHTVLQRNYTPILRSVYSASITIIL